MENDMKTIHCIGDSHCCFFYGQDKVIKIEGKIDSLIPFFKVYYIGPSLAYNLCTLGTTTRGREIIFELLENKIPQGSRILLCFGEIDCRLHILKQAKIQNKDVNTTVEDCVKRYFSFIKEIKAKGYEVLVWNVVATAVDSVQNGEGYPKQGTCEERNSLTKHFNEELKKLLVDESIKFISIFDKLVDGKNLTKEEFYMDPTHLSQKIMPDVIEELRKIFDDVPETKVSDVTKLYIDGNAAKKGWKILNVYDAPYVDYVGNPRDLSFIESDSVDEIYTCRLNRFGHQEGVVAVLKEIYRVLKPFAIFRLTVPNLQILCYSFLHPRITPGHEFQIMNIIFGGQTNITEFNNIGFTMTILEHYLKLGGFTKYRTEPEFKMFKEESSVLVFGQNIMLNLEMTK